MLALLGRDIHADVYAWAVVFFLPINSAINPILYTISSLKAKVNISNMYLHYLVLFKYSLGRNHIKSPVEDMCDISAINSCCSLLDKEGFLFGSVD